MTRSRNKFPVVRLLLYFLIGIALLCGASIAAAMSLGAPPSDQKMIDAFYKNQTAFETLVEMCFEDGIGYLKSRPDIENPRWAAYNSLFEETGIVNGVRCSNDTAELSAFSWGLSISGRSKYYAFNPSDIDSVPVVESLDGNLEHNGETSSTRAYMLIEKDWYLAYYGN